MDQIVVIVLLIIPLFIMPLILTIVNVINLVFAFINRPVKKKFFGVVDFLTMGFGIVFTLILISLLEFKDYNKAIMINSGLIDLHTPIASWNIVTVLALFAVGIVGYIILRIRKNALPPIQIVIAFSFMFIGMMISCLWIVQLSNQLFDMFVFYLILFPMNFIICSLTLIKNTLTEYVLDMSDHQNHYKNKFLSVISKLLIKSNNWIILAAILMIPILFIVMLILILFGQQPDAIVKAFTETSDWTLSQKISPPPIEYDAHYLCTVSLRGHKKIVKPLRYGIRRNNKIVVNRQLLIANAFEQLIEEKVPKTHRFIRYVYDKYGYPLSKHITTTWSADIVYFVMKPLEWFFLIVLYTCDNNPETRIAKQYLSEIP